MKSWSKFIHFIKKNAFENFVWKMATILSRPQWVNINIVLPDCSSLSSCTFCRIKLYEVIMVVANGLEPVRDQGICNFHVDRHTSGFSSQRVGYVESISMTWLHHVVALRLPACIHQSSGPLVYRFVPIHNPSILNSICKMSTILLGHKEPLLLTWINFSPSMDK